MLTGNPSAVLTLGLGSWGSTGLLLSLGLGAGEDTAQFVYGCGKPGVNAKRNIPSVGSGQVAGVGRVQVLGIRECN